MNRHASEFIEKGFTQLALSTELTPWVTKVRALAEEDTAARDVPAGRWLDNGSFRVPPVPEIPLLDETLAEVLVYPGRLGPVCQLSSIFEGYGSARPNRHVDGAYGDLAWAGLLVGINLVDIPPDGAGNLLVWPGTHRATQARFNGLKRPLRAEEVQKAIQTNSGEGQPLKLHGPAGTVTLMDHRLEHGMAPHGTPGFTRHVVYFRLPAFTGEPAEVVNARHFLRHG